MGFTAHTVVRTAHSPLWELAHRMPVRAGSWDNLHIAPLQQNWETATSGAHGGGAGTHAAHAVAQQRQAEELHSAGVQQQMQAGSQADTGHGPRASALTYNANGQQVGGGLAWRNAGACDVVHQCESHAAVWLCAGCAPLSGIPCHPVASVSRSL